MNCKFHKGFTSPVIFCNRSCYFYHLFSKRSELFFSRQRVNFGKPEINGKVEHIDKWEKRKHCCLLNEWEERTILMERRSGHRWNLLTLLLRGNPSIRFLLLVSAGKIPSSLCLILCYSLLLNKYRNNMKELRGFVGFI